jgi:hypothetical protein
LCIDCSGDPEQSHTNRTTTRLGFKCRAQGYDKPLRGGSHSSVGSFRDQLPPLGGRPDRSLGFVPSSGFHRPHRHFCPVFCSEGRTNCRYGSSRLEPRQIDSDAGSEGRRTEGCDGEAETQASRRRTTPRDPPHSCCSARPSDDDDNHSPANRNHLIASNHLWNRWLVRMWRGSRLPQRACRPRVQFRMSRICRRAPGDDLREHSGAVPGHERHRNSCALRRCLHERGEQFLGSHRKERRSDRPVRLLQLNQGRA